MSPASSASPAPRARTSPSRNALAGLPPELLEGVLAKLSPRDWARARATCRLLRDLADAPLPLAAQLTRPGIGRRHPSEVAALGRAERIAAVGQRARREDDVDRRQLAFDLWGPASDGRAVQGLDGPGLLLATGSGGLRVTPLVPGRPPALLPQGHDESAVDRSIHMLCVTGSFLCFLCPPGLFFWTHTGAMGRTVGALGHLDDEVADMTVAPSGHRGGVVSRAGEVAVGNVLAGDVRRWRPCGPRTAGAPTAYPQSLTIAGDDVVIVLDDHGIVSGWRLDPAAPPHAWWEVSLPAARSGAAVWRASKIHAIGDGQHVLARPGKLDGRARPGVPEPCLLFLDGQRRPARGAEWLWLGRDESLTALKPPRRGDHLAGLVAGPWGQEARRWTLSSSAALGLLSAPICFARRPTPLAHLALCEDGALAAVAASPPGAASQVALWRLDLSTGPALVWNLTTHEAPCRSLAFFPPNDDLILVTEAGAALVCWRQAPETWAVYEDGRRVLAGATFRHGAAYALDGAGL